MATGTIPLPYTGTTSGKILDTSEFVIGSTTVERERMVIADDATASALAPVTSSYGLAVDVKTTSINVVSASSGVVQTLTSGPMTISGSVTVVSASSGLVQTLTTGPMTISGTVAVLSASSGVVQTLTSGPMTIASGTVTLSSAIGISSGTVTLSSAPTVVSASSGIEQVLIVTSSGVNLYSTAGVIVSVAGSSGAFAPVTSSGGLLVTNVGTGGAGSTAVNIVATSGILIPGTSSGGLFVTITNPSAAGAGSTAVNLLGTANQMATITTSGGVLTYSRGHQFIQELSTVGAPVVVAITTLPATVYSVATITTAAVAHYTMLFNTSPTALASVASTFLIGLVSAAANTYLQTLQSAGGILATGGLWHAGVLSLGSTTSLSIQFRTNIEYDV